MIDGKPVESLVSFLASEAEVEIAVGRSCIGNELSCCWRCCCCCQLLPAPAPVLAATDRGPTVHARPARDLLRGRLLVLSFRNSASKMHAQRAIATEPEGASSSVPMQDASSSAPCLEGTKAGNVKRNTAPCCRPCLRPSLFEPPTPSTLTSADVGAEDDWPALQPRCSLKLDAEVALAELDMSSTDTVVVFVTPRELPCMSPSSRALPVGTVVPSPASSACTARSHSCKPPPMARQICDATTSPGR
mmetsp:Transcript_29546/g.96544  ORF Transcript_29546/g.96544 Transcript_29546/m.96544 type:complete len:247 (-) Transcript_29546:780-1520(-)